MTIKDIRFLRLHKQHINYQPLKTARDVIANMGAIQGQDYNGALWSIGLRTQNARLNGIEEELEKAAIVRTWLMRGTLHIVASSDLQTFLKLFSERIIKSCQTRYKELELDSKTLMKCDHLLTGFLGKSGRLNRSELLTHLEHNKISVKGQRASYILQHTALRGLICQTTTIKNIPNYILTDGLPSENGTIKGQIIAELFKRYMNSRGPATVQDFVWWTGLTKADALQGLEANRTSLQQLVYNDQTYWFFENGDHGFQNQLNYQLLPGFDEFLLGYKERSISLEKQYANFWCPGNNGMFMPFIVKNGEVIGVWKKTSGKEIRLSEIKYFNNRNTIPEEEINKVFEKYLYFLNKK